MGKPLKMLYLRPLNTKWKQTLEYFQVVPQTL